MSIYDTYSKASELDFVNPRRAVIDFSLLAIIGYLFLAFLNFGEVKYLIKLPFPFYVVFILSLLRKRFAYSAAIGVFIGFTLMSLLNSSILVSLNEWALFFRTGSSLLFFDLSHAPLLLISTGLAINAYKMIRKTGLFRREVKMHALSISAVLVYYFYLMFF